MPLHKQNGKRWGRILLTSMLLIGLIANSSACTKRLQPNADDGRGCYLFVVQPETLAAVQVLVPAAKNGDLLISRACDDANTELILNDIRRMTHEHP